MIKRLHARREDEEGTALVLALVFVFAIGMILVAVINLAGNSLLNTNNLHQQRAVEFAADGATNAAVQWVRNSCPPGSGATNCAGMYTGSEPSCLPSNAPSMTLNGATVVVYCTGDVGAGSRTVQFYTCRSGVASSSCNTTGSNAGNLLLQATVSYYDLNPDDTDTCTTTSPSPNSCGIGMSVQNWNVNTSDN